MTDIVDQAAEAMRQLPPADRDSIARAVLSIVRGGQPLDIEPEHMAAVLEGLAQIERGAFATDAEMAEAFRSFEQ